MLTLLLLLAVPVLAAAALFWWQRRQHVAVQSRVGMARQDCEQLLELVKLLQQHRGMSSARLGGDTSFEAPLRERRRDIDAALGSLARTVKAEADMPRPCITHNELVLFRHRWNELIEKLPTQSIEQSIALHTQLIGRALDWLAALGEARIELPSQDRLPAPLVRNYTNHLPALAECLGQIRAIGAAAAAQRHCSPVARVRLMFLVTRATTLIGQAGGGSVESVTVLARQAVDSLLGTVRRDILTGSEVRIGAESYFATATSAIDAVYAWARHCGHQIGEMLDQHSRLASNETVQPG
ncbi:nitrate- and nitrite sensing domain-containing protein [Uliginosibacterium sp. H1]|uniref:nitrate- and nitrite sensing domain-containing protein n=1 Tax=Uliginosibacterium sp. H1 TaxID=3114757 RepID=UPI002E193919|nr:nitrate- and nitrite sensing domain-containing protein [Uliginosibacterium sp. H1]